MTLSELNETDNILNGDIIDYFFIQANLHLSMLNFKCYFNKQLYTLFGPVFSLSVITNSYEYNYICCLYKIVK